MDTEHLLALLGMLAEWLVFTFSLLQAFLEFAEQDRFIKNLQINASKYKKIPFWYWIIPPYKIYREQKRVYQILAEGIVSEDDYDETLSFMHRALAWIYISIGGAIAGAISIYELFDMFQIDLPTYQFWLVILGAVLASVLYVRYRVSRTRAKLFRKKFFRHKR